MRRIRLDTAPQVGSPVTLSSPEAHYVARVLRLRVGDTIDAFDGSGHAWRLRLTTVSGTTVQGQVIAAQTSTTTAPTPVILGQALPKGSKLDLIVEKGSELGLTTLAPLYTERTVVREVGNRDTAKLARWRRIAEAAAQQCGRHTVLDVCAPQALTDFCVHYRSTPAKILCWEKEPQCGIRQCLETLTDRGPLVVLVGPEGGLTSQEVAVARSHGFVTVSLGPRILRTETAAITIISLIRYSRDELSPLGELG